MEKRRFESCRPRHSQRARELLGQVVVVGQLRADGGLTNTV